MVDFSAAITSKGQVTIPKGVREALGLDDGDRVLFRVVEGAVILARTPDLLEVEGVVPIPAGAADLPWEDVRRRAHAAQGRRGA